MKKGILTILACLFLVSNLTAQESKQDSIVSNKPNKLDPAILAQQQLDGYNARDIEAFLKPYAEDVKIYNFPNELSMEGKETMRPIYTEMFEKVKDLHCEVTNRMVLGNKVIDHEKITGFIEGDYYYAIAIYTIENNKISEVRFLKPE